jgi:hypothetical protein
MAAGICSRVWSVGDPLDAAVKTCGSDAVGRFDKSTTRKTGGNCLPVAPAVTGKGAESAITSRKSGLERGFGGQKALRLHVCYIRFGPGTPWQRRT